MVESSVCFWNPAKHLDLLAWCPAPSIRQCGLWYAARYRGGTCVRPTCRMCLCRSEREASTCDARHGVGDVQYFMDTQIREGIFALVPSRTDQDHRRRRASRLQAQAAGRPYRRQLW